MAVLGGEEANGKGVVPGQMGAVEADTDFALARC